MKNKRIQIIFFLIIIFLSGMTLSKAQKVDGLALTPPMGWNSWNTFASNINEKLILQMVDSFVSKGMQKAGYKYIVIDDCWESPNRDSLGNLVPDPVKFPNGLKAVGYYIHSKGLKFGIHNCAGIKTCAGLPGGRGHEYQDALCYAKWGVDFLKYDWCTTDGLNAEAAFSTMRDALYATGRPIVLSICEWGNNNPWLWGKSVGHLWRTTGDITNCFDCELNHVTWSQWGVMKIVYMREGIRKYAGPDHWNDPDMLEVGNGMSVNEDKAHFSLWCMLAAPLIAGNDIRIMSKETNEILTNKEVIAIDQDSLGIQGFPYSAKDSLEVWVKPLMNDNWAVCFLNRSVKSQKLDFDWSRNIINDDIFNKTLDAGKSVYKIRDLWLKKDQGTTQKNISCEIPSHGIIMLKLSK